MKIALFDQVNETHVCQAFAQALDALGHEVLETGAVWRGHRLPSLAQDAAAIDAALETVLSAGCDALFNFRASALDTARVSRLRAAGVATAVWLPDDPVLYDVTYRHVVDAYDHVLHCGAESVLAFYASRGHRPGVNFPFWLDPARWPHAWDPDRVQRELVFLGNLHGPAKQGRYQRLAPARGRISLYGICPHDPLGLHAGELHGIDAMLAVLPLFRAGLNLPQRFAEYAGSGYDFPGLAALGTFDLPSRVVQYAALGLPVITLDERPPSDSFPCSLHAQDIEEALRLSDQLAADPGAARDVSLRARVDVESNFSAVSRARLLAALLSGELDPGAMQPEARATCYRNFPGNPP